MTHKAPTLPERRAMGARLKAARERAGLSIDEAMAQLGPDTFRASLMGAERVGRLSMHSFWQLCQIYGCSADWILDLDTEESEARGIAELFDGFVDPYGNGYESREAAAMAAFEALNEKETL